LSLVSCYFLYVLEKIVQELINDSASEYNVAFPFLFQPIQLSDSCNTPGLILHQLMHALGFYHEHTRDDRDKFVKVIYRNVKDGKIHKCPCIVL